jgi:hypothetical protein
MMRIFILLFASIAFADEPSQLHFEYKELLEPFDTYSCNHLKANVGIFDWDVSCAIRGGETRKFFAHVVVSQYPKTNFGVNSYEILYWVTDMSDPMKFHNSSSTFWIHNSSTENKMNVLEASQGIENDNAYLKLSYIPR